MCGEGECNKFQTNHALELGVIEIPIAFQTVHILSFHCVETLGSALKISPLCTIPAFCAFPK